MFTIDEAKISKPTASHTVPAGASWEYGQENIQRALQDQAEAAEKQQTESLLKLAKTALCRLTGATVKQTDAQMAASAGEPQASH